MMVAFEQAQKLALKEKDGQIVVNAAKYKNYFVFFMQPKGIDPASENALLDNYVIVNSESGKIEYRSLFEFDNFFDEAITIK